jgi:hypothetical protein
MEGHVSVLCALLHARRWKALLKACACSKSAFAPCQSAFESNKAPEALSKAKT